MPRYQSGYYHQHSEESDNDKPIASFNDLTSQQARQLVQDAMLDGRPDLKQRIAEWDTNNAAFRAQHPEYLDGAQNGQVMRDELLNMGAITLLDGKSVGAPTFEELEQAYYTLRGRNVLAIKESVEDKQKIQAKLSEVKQQKERESRDWEMANNGEMSLEELKIRAAAELRLLSDRSRRNR